MAYIHQVNVDGTNYLIEPTLFITPSFNNNTYTATLTNFTLATGVAVQVKFTTTNSAANPTLQINTEAAKTIIHAGNALSANYLKEGHIYTLIYNGTSWEIVGELFKSANVIQTASFTLTGVSGTGSATIGSDTTISSNTEIVQISIDYTTASYLNSPISWTITNNRIVLSASVTTDESVTGKIYFIKNSA